MKSKSLNGLSAYLVVAFAIPWAGWTWNHNEALSLWLFPLFASIGGFVAAFAEDGKVGLTNFTCRVFKTFGALRYVLVAISIPLLLGLSYLLVTGVSLTSLLATPAAVLGLSLGAALITGPLAEEFGWRGYLQHKFLRRVSPFWAALAVGCIWWAWHFALYRTSVFASPYSALNFLAYLVAWSLFMVFLVQRAEGSVLPAIALHWAANTHPGVLQALLPAVDGSSLPGGSKGSVYYLGAALVFSLVNYRFFFARSPSPSMLHATADNSFKPKPLRGSA